MEVGWSEPGASRVSSGAVVKLPLLILFWLAQGWVPQVLNRSGNTGGINKACLLVLFKD